MSASRLKMDQQTSTPKLLFRAILRHSTRFGLALSATNGSTSSFGWEGGIQVRATLPRGWGTKVFTDDPGYSPTSHLELNFGSLMY